MNRITCEKCGAEICSDKIQRHMRGSQCKTVVCRLCNQTVPYINLKRHQECHVDNPNRQNPTIERSQPELPEFHVDENYEDIYSTFSRYIRPYVREGRLTTVFNYQLDEFNPQLVDSLMSRVYQTQTNSFKVNISISYILRNIETNELCFYWASPNNQLLFKSPTLINSHGDYRSFSEQILSLDLRQFVDYPNTKYLFVKATNVTFYTTKLLGIPIGFTTSKIPNYLKNNKGLYSLVTANKTGIAYSDNLCFFRCVALFRGFKVDALEVETKRLYAQFCGDQGIDVDDDYTGICLEELDDASKLFDIGINVYHQQEGRSTELVYRSLKQTNTMYLNIFDGHFSYIKDFGKYSSAYCCSSCGKIWRHHGDYVKHSRICDGATRKIYKNGIFSLPQTIFDQLEVHGIRIPNEMRFFDYRICFDIECTLNSETTISDSTRVSYTFEHQLASISVSSNVPGYDEPSCFVSDGCTKTLVAAFVKYITEIAETAAELQEEKFAEFNPRIEELEDVTLQERFDEYLAQIPVMSFNGSKYDLKVLREQLIPILVEAAEVKYVIKRGSSYACIATENFKFLDILSYLPAGTNYDSFLKAFGTETKSFFPYEWFSSLDQLECTEFPSYDNFYSSLKNKNTLEPCKSDSLTTQDSDIIGRVPTAENKLTDDEIRIIASNRYYGLRDMFYVNSWTFRDYLVYYNNLDVQPFLAAVENMSQYYVHRGVDIFKNAISVPGIAQRLAFKTTTNRDTFFLFNRRHKDLVHLFFKNNVGGPAIIFTRFHQSGVTKIRHQPDGKDCASILGLDANALYLWCTGQEMPCGMYVRRKRETNFMKDYPTPISRKSTDWLAHLENTENIDIEHARNSKEFRVGHKQRAVDGFCRESNCVYQFHGCWYHGCPSCKPHKRDDKSYGRSLNKKYEQTKKTGQYIRDCGHDLIEMWECDWDAFRVNNTTVNQYAYPTEQIVRMTELQIISHIQNDRLFGVVEVDLHVPNELKEYFQEMPPIFKHATVKLEHIGRHMQEYLTAKELDFKDRKYLIGSMHATKILLITPLLKWYLNHGLIVDKVHQVIEFSPRRCFQTFADTVSDDRRAGDRDPAFQVLAETSKLIGNSFYGYTVMNKSRHHDVNFCSDPEALNLVNNPRFMSIEEFDGGFCEVTSNKQRIKYDLPLQIGYFVYQYAKLRMLAFHFDVLDKFIDRSDYELCSMDTDSLYMALSGRCLDELVKSELRHEWEATKSQWFPRTDTEEHRAYDKRTPGLFKVEWAGDGFVGLSAKTYYCFNDTDSEKDKYSSKGINKSLNLSKEDYLGVLETKRASRHTNRGFLFKGNTMFSYNMQRKGLDYVYAKRKLLSDGISTTYLDL